MIRQVHPNSLGECLGLNKSKHKESMLSGYTVSNEHKKFISKISNKIAIVKFERKLVSKKKESLVFKIHMKWRDVCHE